MGPSSFILHPSPRSLVLLSGGLDSTVSLMVARQQSQVELAITFDYGQRAALREVEAARAICARLGIEHWVIQLPWLAQATRTALVRPELPLPSPTPDDLSGEAAEQSARAVWVPNRNGVFINIAAALAEARGIELIVTGFNAEEGATFPDNTPGFVEAINQSLRWSTLSHPRVVSYTQSLDKAAIRALGERLGAPLELVWSCYEGGPEPCGTCESCLRSRRAAG